MRNLLTLSRLLSGLLLLTLVAIVAYWAMQLLAPRPAIAPSGSLGDAATTRNLNAAVAAFGATGPAQPVAAVPTNIQIIGVAESGKNGVAIIAVDGRPALPYAVGAQVDDATRLVSALDGVVVLEQNGRRIEAKAPERPSIAVLSSGLGKSRDPNRAPPPPPRSYNLPPRAAPPPGTMSPPVFSPPVPPAQQPVPAGQAEGQGQLGIPPGQAQAQNPGQPQGMVPGQQPGQFGGPAQYTAPQFNPQTGEATPGIVQPGFPQPNQAPGNPAGGFQAGMPPAPQPQ
jgi:general secretion pathway protein C